MKRTKPILILPFRFWVQTDYAVQSARRAGTHGGKRVPIAELPELFRVLNIRDNLTRHKGTHVAEFRQARVDVPQSFSHRAASLDNCTNVPPRIPYWGKDTMHEIADLTCGRLRVRMDHIGSGKDLL